MKKLLMIPVLATLTFGGATLAQMTMPGMDHSTMNMSGSSMSGTMGMADLAKLKGKAFERAFLSMMVPHHQAAIDMARAVPAGSGDPTVRRWAKAVIADQGREISQMNTLLKAYGGSDTRMAAMMAGGMKGMGQRVKASRSPDRTFVQDMIPHHASALEMAGLALQKASNPAVLRLARDIARAQASEMHDFQIWLQKR